MREQLPRDIGQPAIADGGKDDRGCDNANNAWYVTVSAATVSNNNKYTNNYRVRPVSATPRVVYDIPFSTVVRAWRECEKHKLSSPSCIKFRWHAARDLVELWHQMCTGTYKPRASMCFMVEYPVLREVWAAAFRDRVAHHWEYERFGPVIEDFFVEVGDVSMNCRKGYGSLRAVHTFERMLYDYTDGYSRDDCWIVGGDIANFFMSIDKALLWQRLEPLLRERYSGADLEALVYMMHATIMHRCTENYYCRSARELWNGLPQRKSLFFMDGLAIGNLPNQILANFMGALFTRWIMQERGYKDFLIFVDDFRVLVRTAAEGRALLADIRRYLQAELHLTLHPDKIYLQHYRKGTRFVGAMILPGRAYVSNRTRGRFISTMMKFNREATTHTIRVSMLADVRASINSYLGLMSHYNAYKVRRKICEKYILPTWGKYLYFVEEFRVCKVRKEYDKIYSIRKRLRSHKYAAKFIRPKAQAG